MSTLDLNSIISLMNDFLYSKILIFILLGAGIYFTFSTGFIQFNLKNMLQSFKESFSSSKEEKSSRKISSFEAFAVSTASRVGTGNLAGVALAITVGGPGAIFWMWITALLGGSLSFAESTLAQVYKMKDKSDNNHNPHYYGGPSYYISQGLGSKTLGGIFASLLIFVFGFSFNAVQANTISNAFQSSFTISTIHSAIVLSILTAIFIFRGLPKIAKASSIIVPIMAILYLLLCLFVIGKNISRLPEVLNMIFSNAFGIKEFGVGTITGTIITGIKRGLFSNEAGMGSAPNAAATATTSHPVKQGLIQAFGVFFDTIIICSATAFLILFSGVDFTDRSIPSIVLTQNALSSYFGSFGNIFLAICIFLLAFSSILGNYFYAQGSMAFLTSNKKTMFIFKIIVILSVFFGSLSPFTIVWNIADLLMGLMALINIYTLFRLGKVLKLVLLDYKKQQAKNIDPIFKKENIPNLENIECWK